MRRRAPRLGSSARTAMSVIHQAKREAGAERERLRKIAAKQTEDR